MVPQWTQLFGVVVCLFVCLFVFFWGARKGGRGEEGRERGEERELGGGGVANKVVVFNSHLKGKHSAILFSCE